MTSRAFLNSCCALLLLSAFAITPCQAQQPTLRALYEAAMRDASHPEAGKIDRNLQPITSTNKELIHTTIAGEDYILAVSWKSDTMFYHDHMDPVTHVFSTGGYPMWVTVAPELLKKMYTFHYTDQELRLKQLLGLPPDTSQHYKYFVECWVRPRDMFRPCPDPATSDRQCDLCFPANTDSAHINWINSNRISRYYDCDLYHQYPWTQLGYTYDWSPTNTTHHGLSEFVIGANANVVIKKFYTTAEYLKK